MLTPWCLRKQGDEATYHGATPSPNLWPVYATSRIAETAYAMIWPQIGATPKHIEEVGAVAWAWRPETFNMA